MVMLVLHAKFEVFLVKFATNVTWGQFSGIFDIKKIPIRGEVVETENHICMFA